MSRLSTPFVGLSGLSRQSLGSHDHATNLPLEAGAQAKTSLFSTEPTMYDAAVPFTRVG